MDVARSQVGGYDLTAQALRQAGLGGHTLERIGKCLSETKRETKVGHSLWKLTDGAMTLVVDPYASTIESVGMGAFR